MEEQTNQVPWVMDAEGNSLQVSSHWVQDAAVHKGRPRNLGWLEALHGDDIGPTMRTMKEALRTGEAIDIQYRVCVDEEWRWMRSRGSARLGASGEILRWYERWRTSTNRGRRNLQRLAVRLHWCRRTVGGRLWGRW